MIAQGLGAALESSPELELNLLPMIQPSNACMDVLICKPDILVIDVTRELQKENLLHLCKELRQKLPFCKLLLLFSENEPEYHTLSIQAKHSALIDDFAFYNNSMKYLLAKLAALC